MSWGSCRWPDKSDPNLRFHGTITGMLAVDALLAGNWQVFGSALTHLILPSMALAVAGLSQVVRLVRASMIEVLRREHVRAMTLRGVPRMRIAFKYALKPALIPALTMVGLTFASLFGEAFLIEAVFGWPGIASYGRARDAGEGSQRDRGGGAGGGADVLHLQPGDGSAARLPRSRASG